MNHTNFSNSKIKEKCIEGISPATVYRCELEYKTAY